jgi:hypothetical protein
MTRFIFTLLSIIILCSCKFNNTISKEDATDIVRIMYGTEPLNVLSYRWNDRMYIGTAIKNQQGIHLHIIEEFADSWQKKTHYLSEANSSIRGDDETLGMQFTVIKDQLYLYFKEADFGSSAGSVNFNLLSLDSGLLQIWGYVESGKFSHIDIPAKLEKLEGKPYLDFLESKIQESVYVARHNLDKLDPETEWRLKNTGIYKKLSFYKEIPLSFTYYRDFEKIRLGSSFEQIDNNYYNIIAYFKSYVIVFDIAKDRCFIAWVPELIDWITNMEFKSDHQIILQDNISSPKRKYVLNLLNNSIMEID